VSLGLTPIVLCWDTWDSKRQKVEMGFREEQVKKVCKLLHLLLSYGANPDLGRSDGSTALHIAARLCFFRPLIILL